MMFAVTSSDCLSPHCFGSRRAISHCRALIRIFGAQNKLLGRDHPTRQRLAVVVFGLIRDFEDVLFKEIDAPRAREGVAKLCVKVEEKGGRVLPVNGWGWARNLPRLHAGY